MIGDIIILEEWKSVLMAHGEKSVMTIGKTEMQVLSAGSLDFLIMVNSGSRLMLSSVQAEVVILSGLFLKLHEKPVYIQ